METRSEALLFEEATSFHTSVACLLVYLLPLLDHILNIQSKLDIVDVVLVFFEFLFHILICLRHFFVPLDIVLLHLCHSLRGVEIRTSLSFDASFNVLVHETVGVLDIHNVQVHLLQFLAEHEMLLIKLRRTVVGVLDIDIPNRRVAIEP